MMNQPESVFSFSGDKLELLDLLLVDEGLAETAVTPTISPRPQSDDPLPLSFAQQRLWFLDALTPGSSLFNTPLALRLTGQLNEVALTQACQALVQRHESLRTTFTAVSGTPQQIIHDNWPVALDKMSVTADELDDVLQTAVQHPFDLEKGPLLRFHLLRYSPTEHVLLLVFHHIIFDGWSAGIVVDELVAMYEAFSHRRQPDLPELPIQYADYALWQRDWLTGDTLQAQRDYWQTQLAGELSLLQLPTDRPRPPVKTHSGAVETVLLPPQLTSRVTALCRQTGSTPFMLLLAAFQVLLHRYTAQEDILVGTPIANRQQAELEELVGFFVNTLVLRSRVDGEQTFRNLLAQVRDTATTAYDHPDVPFEKLVELLQPERNLSYDPLFQVMFSYQDGAIEERPLPSLTITPFDLDNGMAQFDLTLSVSLEESQFYCGLNYNTDLFLPETIQRMLGHWQTLLAAIVETPDSRIDQLSLLMSVEIDQLLLDWNDTALEYDTAVCIHHLIEAQAKKRPHDIAIVYEDQQLTYQQLNNRANQMARQLRQLGVEPDTIVGVFMERAVEMMVALVGIHKAGGAYLPLDPTYPLDRIAFMVEDTAAPVLLTQAHLLSSLPPHQAQVICVDSDWPQIAERSDDNFDSSVMPDNLAYVIYTSGSTGKPKGVMVQHGNVINFFAGMDEVIGTQVDSENSPGTWLSVTSLSFDISVLELFWTLSRGCKVVIHAEKKTPGRVNDAYSISAQIERHSVTHFQCTPSMASMLLLDERNVVALGKLQTMMVGGEALPATLAQQLKQIVSGRVINMYGPTETTIWSTTHEVTGEETAVPIGRPIANTKIYILDKNMRPVPIGVAGDLYIGGDGVVRGYLNRPELTAKRFVPRPFLKDELRGKKDEFIPHPSSFFLYKTGDLARYRADGNIDFLGRADFQVKLRGYRIELGEIEALLNAHESVREAVVTAREDTPGDQRLVAYVIMQEGEQLDSAVLKESLRAELPEFMVPATYLPMSSFPLTPNKKTDRKSLPAPEGQHTAATDAIFVAPQDVLESQLTQIWQGILHLPAVSTDANYFDLGGHSLQAVTLFAAIEKRLKLRLPVSLLFEAPTIRQLAAAIRQRGQAPQWSSLVPIQPLGGKAPLFCVHGGAGHVFHYHDLARLLGTERPFYGLQPKLDETTHQSVFKCVEEMAAHYIQEIKMVQPEGPYLLSGFCFGGIVVYEMAQQLKRAGDEVGLLVFIDPSTPQNKPSMPQADSAEETADRLARHKSNLAQLGRLARLGYILNSSKNRLKGHWHDGYRAWGRNWRKIRAWLIQQYINWQQVVPSRFHDFYFMHVISTQATQGYQPQRYPGEAVLFYSTLENGGDESLGWSDLSEEGLKMYAVESTHLGILKRPYIDQVAAELKQHLEPFA